MSSVKNCKAVCNKITRLRRSRQQNTDFSCCRVLSVDTALERQQQIKGLHVFRRSAEYALSAAAAKSKIWRAILSKELEVIASHGLVCVICHQRHHRSL